MFCEHLFKAFDPLGAAFDHLGYRAEAAGSVQMFEQASEELHVL
jgi:hypothetical protein